MKVMSFNICCWNDPEDRMPLVKESIDRRDPDIIGIQEMRHPFWEKFFNENYTDRYEFFFKYRKENNLEATPILWKKDKFDCIDKGYFWFSDTPDVESGGWDDYAGCYRIVNWAKLKEKASGKEFTFINTHYGFGEENQVKYAKLLFERMDMMKAGPTILTADFNMNETALGYKALTERFINLNKATANEEGPTYHGYDMEKNGNLLPIDFIFINDGVEPISFERMTDEFEGKFKYASDHFGICGEVEIK